MNGLRKFLARRVRLRIVRPVLIDGDTFVRGAVVEVSREQEVDLIATACAVPADDFTAGHLHVVPRGASVRMLPEVDPARARKPWRPRNASNRVAPRGSMRIHPGASIVDQVRDLVDR